MDVSAGPRYPECPAGCGANDCARIVGAGGRIGPRRSVLSSRHPFRVPIEILTQNSSSRLRDFMAKPRMPHSPPGRKDAKNREEDFRKRGALPGQFLVFCPMDGLSGDQKYTRNTGLRCASRTDSVGTPDRKSVV